MNSLCCTGSKGKNSNALTFTIKLASFQAVISLLDKIKTNTVTMQPNNPSYIPYMISSTITECVHRIKPELNQRIMSRFTQSLALGIGIVVSSFSSVGYDGVNYFISLTLNLIKTSVTTLIIEFFNTITSIPFLLHYNIRWARVVDNNYLGGVL
jgi:hypothetical protein